MAWIWNGETSTTEWVPDDGSLSKGDLVADLTATKPQDSPEGWIDPNASGSAASLASQLLRAQYAEWEKTFKPIEMNLTNQLSFKNPEVLSGALSKARQTATGMSDAVSGILSRQNAAMGITPTTQQQATSRRLIDLNKALSIAGASNQARENVRTQDEQILLGTVPNPNIVGASS